MTSFKTAKAFHGRNGRNDYRRGKKNPFGGYQAVDAPWYFACTAMAGEDFEHAKGNFSRVVDHTFKGYTSPGTYGCFFNKTRGKGVDYFLSKEKTFRKDEWCRLCAVAFGLTVADVIAFVHEFAGVNKNAGSDDEDEANDEQADVEEDDRGADEQADVMDDGNDDAAANDEPAPTNPQEYFYVFGGVRNSTSQDILMRMLPNADAVQTLIDSVDSLSQRFIRFNEINSHYGLQEILTSARDYAVGQGLLDDEPHYFNGITIERIDAFAHGQRRVVGRFDHCKPDVVAIVTLKALREQPVIDVWMKTNSNPGLERDMYYEASRVTDMATGSVVFLHPDTVHRLAFGSAEGFCVLTFGISTRQHPYDFAFDSSLESNPYLRAVSSDYRVFGEKEEQFLENYKRWVYVPTEGMAVVPPAPAPVAGKGPAGKRLPGKSTAGQPPARKATKSAMRDPADRFFEDIRRKQQNDTRTNSFLPRSKKILQTANKEAVNFGMFVRSFHPAVWNMFGQYFNDNDDADNVPPLEELFKLRYISEQGFKLLTQEHLENELDISEEWSYAILLAINWAVLGQMFFDVIKTAFADDDNLQLQVMNFFRMNSNHLPFTDVVELSYKDLLSELKICELGSEEAVSLFEAICKVKHVAGYDDKDYVAAVGPDVIEARKREAERNAADDDDDDVQPSSNKRHKADAMADDDDQAREFNSGFPLDRQDLMQSLESGTGQDPAANVIADLPDLEPFA